MAKTITVTLTGEAEQYFNELMYSLELPNKTGKGRTQCTHGFAINHALTELALFEKATDDQVTNWLQDNHPEIFEGWPLNEREG